MLGGVEKSTGVAFADAHLTAVLGSPATQPYFHKFHKQLCAYHEMRTFLAARITGTLTLPYREPIDKRSQPGEHAHAVS